MAGAIGGMAIVVGIAKRVLDRRLGPIQSPIGLQLGGDPASADAVRQLTADLDTLREEVTGLRRELDEAVNRLDFTERLLAQVKERGLLNAPKER